MTPPAHSGAEDIVRLLLTKNRPAPSVALVPSISFERFPRPNHLGMRYLLHMGRNLTDKSRLQITTSYDDLIVSTMRGYYKNK